MEIILNKFTETASENIENRSGKISFNALSKIIYNEGEILFLHEQKEYRNYIYTMPYVFMNSNNKTASENCKEYIENLIKLNSK